jgi:hypothetical protein
MMTNEALVAEKAALVAKMAALMKGGGYNPLKPPPVY